MEQSRIARVGWKVWLGAAALVLAVALVVTLTWCRGVRQTMLQTFSKDYAADVPQGEMQPELASSAPGKRIEVTLTPVAEGFTRPTDLKFVPGKPSVAVVLEKPGRARWFSLKGDDRGTWLEMEVITEVEQGLLGVAFHPRFQSNGKLYINATVRHEGQDVSEVSEWQVEDPAAFPRSRPERKRLIMRVEQPYANHNAGQLQFGPDGNLYVGWGDGGFRADPLEAGQDPSSFLGSMLRVDVDHPSDGRPYGIPDDNPFVGRDGYRPETWAYGLRNPWRYSFDPAGRLIVADVGQNKWEEIDIVAAGDNLGWDIMEGRHCFEPDEGCEREGLVLPVHEYGHEEGKSITGGYVYTGKRVQALRGYYLFGDFVSGRLWALKLPAERGAGEGQLRTLGRWPLQPVTFGRDLDGEVYVAGYARGVIYRIDPS